MSGSVGDNPYRASGVIAAAAAGGGVSWQDVVTASTLTAEAGNGYPINTTSNACTVTLPAAASVGDQIIFTDYARNFATNALTINPNSLNYQGASSPNPVYDTNGESIHIVYMDATKGWIPTYDGAVAYETPQTADIEYLMIAGGGAGGYANSSTGYGRGGGGAGGYLTNFGATATTLTQGTTYTIAVGTGGDPVSGQYGENGVDSSFSGTGLTTITATAGGGGGGETASYEDGRDGGSGGGGGFNSGTGGTPTPSPSQGNQGSDAEAANAGGAGGGAFGGGQQAGTNYSRGGIGLSNSITGAAVDYAGGGGGASGNGSGGTSGGGNGYKHTGVVAATSGSDGTGGGGGGGGYSGATYPTPGSGGNGIFILRVATADKGTASGEDSSAVDGDDTVITWLDASGSYVA